MPRAVNGWKVCSKCREKKPVSAFGKRSANVDGLDYQCKSCRTDIDKAQYEANRERRIVQSKERYEANREEILVQHKVYDATAAGQVARRRFETSVVGRSVRQRASAKRRALEAEAISDLTPEDYVLLDELYPVCVYCGHEFIAGHPLYKRTLEHFAPYSREGQNTFDNVAFACKRCNSSKGNKLPEEWTNRWYEDESEVVDAARAHISSAR